MTNDEIREVIWLMPENYLNLSLDASGKAFEYWTGRRVDEAGIHAAQRAAVQVALIGSGALPLLSR